MTDIEQRVAAAIRAASDANLLPRKDMVIIDPAAESARVLLAALAAGGLVVVEKDALFDNPKAVRWLSYKAEADAMRPVVDAAVAWSRYADYETMKHLEAVVAAFLKEQDG